MEENVALVTINSPVRQVSKLKENEPFTLGGWDLPSNLEESDTPVTIGGWGYPMSDLKESNWDTPAVNWEGIRATLLNEIESHRSEIENIERTYNLEKEQVGQICTKKKIIVCICFSFHKISCIFH